MARTFRPFDDIRLALVSAEEPESAQVRLDPTREARTGVPEIVLGRGKPAEEIAASLARLADVSGRALATRCTPEQAQEVGQALAGRYEVLMQPLARAIVAVRAGCHIADRGGRVGLFTAGSSDRAVAAEAALVARELGATVIERFDVGIAGLHRLVAPLESMIADDVDVIIVAAGMDGALPAVVAGLVAVPVIGLPTSTGYGYGGEGVAALMTMIQSCSPGVVVVNIDNGVGAGSAAALIANRAGRFRADG